MKYEILHRLMVALISTALLTPVVQAQRPHQLTPGNNATILPTQNVNEARAKKFKELLPAETQYRSFASKVRKEKNRITNFQLTKDINRISNSSPDNASFYGYLSSFAICNGFTYFSADDGLHGRELWRSDGTPKGTYLFKDINPGEAASNPGEITNVNGKLYFSAFSPLYGEELWVSDGTGQGTKIMIDGIPGPQGSRPSRIVGAGNSIFFLSSRETDFNTERLWKTDGTPQGTLLLLELTATDPNMGSRILWPTKVNNLLFFTVAAYNFTSIELWRSDGTKQGTFPVKNFGGDFWGLMHLTSYNNKLYFSGRDNGTERKLWMSDGSIDGTVPAPGDNGITLTEYYHSIGGTPLRQIGNYLFIFGNSNVTGGGLYKYDASGGLGMQLVKSFAPPGHPPVAVQSDVAVLNNVLYFKLQVYDGTRHDQLWRSDGTAANTGLVKEFSTDGFISNLYPYDGRIYFAGYDLQTSYYETEPWVSDGTPQGTKVLKEILSGPHGSMPSSFTGINGKVIFNARSENGAELWITNGTEAGTTLLKDINTHSTEGSNAGASSIIPLAEHVIFTAYDGIHGEEIYTSDGSGKGTFLLKDINPEPWESSATQLLVRRKNHVYFIASRPDPSDRFRNISSIYRTNGTTARTEKIADLETYTTQFGVSDNGIIYYGGYHGLSGSNRVYRTDGTVEGTFMLTDKLYSNSNMAVAGNQLYFAAGSTTSGYELWTSDGTKAGTRMIKDIYAGAAGSFPYNLFVFKNEVYFGASDGRVPNASFWKTDGTEMGTVKLSTVTPPTYSYSAAISNGLLYFTASDNNTSLVYGNELWKTDGTPQGTRIVKNINPTSNASPSNLTDVDGKLFFVANDGEHGFELWITDGTEQGTRLVKDISSGIYSNLTALTSAAGRLFFLKNSGSTDSELWSSDGTPENTNVVSDDGLDKMTSMYNLAATKDQLFLTGYSYQYGTELYSSKIKEKSHPLHSVEAKGAVDEKSAGSFTITMFPNPTKAATTLRLNSSTNNLIVTITDITGKVVSRQSYINVMLVSLATEKLAAGLYTVTVTNGAEVKTIKLVKE
jgi:trimeric autotransporter adhesin